MNGVNSLWRAGVKRNSVLMELARMIAALEQPRRKKKRGTVDAGGGNYKGVKKEPHSKKGNFELRVLLCWSSQKKGEKKTGGNFLKREFMLDERRRETG